MTLKTLRNTLGDSQAQFAARLGLTKMTVWRYEQGEPIPYAVELALKALTRSLGLERLKMPSSGETRATENVTGSFK